MFLPRECMRLYCIQSRMTVFHNRTSISSVLFANPDSCTHVKLLLQKVIDVIYFSLSINCTCKLLWTTIKPEDVSGGNHQRSLKFACLVVLTSLHIQHGIFYSTYIVVLLFVLYCIFSPSEPVSPHLCSFCRAGSNQRRRHRRRRRGGGEPSPGRRGRVPLPGLPPQEGRGPEVEQLQRDPPLGPVGPHHRLLRQAQAGADLCQTGLRQPQLVTHPAWKKRF